MTERGKSIKPKYSEPKKIETVIKMKKNQIKVLNVFLDLILFLYNHVKSSLKENNKIIINTISHDNLEKCKLFSCEKTNLSSLKTSGIRISMFVNKQNIMLNKNGVAKPNNIIIKILMLKLL